MTMWAPIMQGMCTLKEMQDGTYCMEDLADMLESIALKNLIERRGQKEST